MNTQTQTSTLSKPLNATLWILQALLGALFIYGGITKLIGTEPMVGLFTAIGVGQWFRYLTGLLEVVGGALLLFPQYASYAGLLMTTVMVGAVLTHLFVVGGSPAIAIVALIGSLVIFLGRKNRA